MTARDNTVNHNAKDALHSVQSAVKGKTGLFFGYHATRNLQRSLQQAAILAAEQSPNTHTDQVLYSSLDSYGQTKANEAAARKLRMPPPSLGVDKDLKEQLQNAAAPAPSRTTPKFRMGGYSG